MKKYSSILLSSLICNLIVIPVWATNESPRDKVIQQEMNEISQHSSTSIDWKDVANASSHESASTTVLENQSINPTSKVHTISLASQSFYSGYTQPKNTGRIKGDWYGIEGKYTFRPQEGSVLNNALTSFYSVECLMAWGKGTKTRLDASVPETLKFKNLGGDLFETRILIGKDIHLLDSINVTPYSGYGYRLRNDYAAGHQNFLSDGFPYWGHDQRTTYKYIPFGITTTVDMHNSYEITYNIEYDLLLRGNVTRFYSDHDRFSFDYDGGVSQDFRYVQKRGYGLRTSFKVVKHFSKIDFFVEPFARFWRIRPSKSSSGTIDLIGPPETFVTNKDEKNYTLESGIKLGIQF